MGKLVEHAKREFKILGYKPIEELPEDDINRWVQEDLIELLEVFEKQRHSGSSAPYIIKLFSKLAMFDILTPLTGQAEEWEAIVGDTYQNKRLSSVFKEKNGKAYYLYAIIWRNQKGVTFIGSITTNKGHIYTSRQYIQFPFKPKRFYVDVIEREDDTYEILDYGQLKRAFEYYVSG